MEIVAVTAFPPSVAVTVCAPSADIGTVNLTPDGMFPEASVVTVAGLVVTMVPSYFIASVECAAKPEPDTLTAVPTGADDGESEMDDAAHAMLYDVRIVMKRTDMVRIMTIDDFRENKLLTSYPACSIMFLVFFVEIKRKIK